MFMHNMLIRPTEEDLAQFGTPDFTIFNAGAFPCNRCAAGARPCVRTAPLRLHYHSTVMLFQHAYHDLKPRPLQHENESTRMGAACVA